MNDVDLLQIDTASNYYSSFLTLREQVLRKPIGLILSHDDTVDDHQQLIFIAVNGMDVIACLMAKKLNHELIKFRQMAVMPTFQGSGIGSDLLSFAEEICRREHVKTFELNARVEAIPFYIKNGYVVTGEEFEEVGIPHKKMYKFLYPDLH